MDCETERVVGSVVLLTFAAALAACAPDSTSAFVERTDSAGVAIVTNTRPDTVLDWTIEEVLRLGGTEDGPEAFFRVDDRGIAFDATGRLYILDTGNFHVQVFDTTGAHVRTLGREGGGPGELQMPYAMFVSPDGVVHVIDLQKRAIVRYGPDGAILDELRMPERAQPNRAMLVPGAGMYSARDTTLNAEDRMEPGARLRSTLIWIPFEGESWGEPLESARLDYRQPESIGVLEMPGCPYRLNMPPIFYRRPVWRVAGERVLHNSTEAYIVDVTSPDSARLSIRRDLPVVEATRENAAVEIGPVVIPESDPCYSTPEQRADQLGWMDLVAWVKDAVRTPDGTILVLRRAPGQDPNERIDAFAADGAYMGTLPPEFPLSAAWRGPDEFVRLEYDDMRRTFVVVYRVQR